MNNKEEFEFFIEQLLDNAVASFKATDQYKLLQEKLKHMDDECDTMFRADEKGFVVECFQLIMEADGREEHFVYRQGFRDCVNVLKWMGVLT